MADITSGIMAMIAGMLVVALIVALVLYVYMAIALMTIAKKTNTPNSWLAWIPIANIYLMTQIAKVQWWTMFAFLLVYIPFIGALAFMAVFIWWWWKIAEARNMPGWYGILLIIPIVNLVIVGIIAWKD